MEHLFIFRLGRHYKAYAYPKKGVMIGTHFHWIVFQEEGSPSETKRKTKLIYFSVIYFCS